MSNFRKKITFYQIYNPQHTHTHTTFHIYWITNIVFFISNTEEDWSRCAGYVLNSNVELNKAEHCLIGTQFDVTPETERALRDVINLHRFKNKCSLQHGPPEKFNIIFSVFSLLPDGCTRSFRQRARIDRLLGARSLERGYQRLPAGHPGQLRPADVRQEVSSWSQTSIRSIFWTHFRGTSSTRCCARSTRSSRF